MLAFPPNYSLPIFLIVLGIMSLFLHPPLRNRLHPRYIVAFAAVAALVCLPIYSINQQQATAYDVGTVIFRFSSWNFTIDSGEVERIDDISNIHTLAEAYFMFYCNDTVTFYLIEQNRPEIHHQETNYTQGDAAFILPYLYAEVGVPARWSVCLLNLNTVPLNVTIQPIWLEDSIEMARWNIQYTLYLPLALLFAIWMTLGLSLVAIHRRRIVSQAFFVGLLLIGPGIVLGVVLFMIAPSFLLVSSPLIPLLAIPVILILHKKQKQTLVKATTEIECS